MVARTYRLTVDGELGDSMASVFPGMTLTRQDGMTMLSGEIRDQAELQGLFERLSDLGLTLLETKSAESEKRSGSDPTSAVTTGRT